MAHRHLEHEDGGRDELEDELDEDQGVLGLRKELAEEGAAARGASPCPSRFSRPCKLTAAILSSSPATVMGQPLGGWERGVPS